ncbi:hypothetical protein A0H81_03511 [Grifola frondosa]|uniref:DUF6534 domain-containing protein n=1 Tax=Grifola frondosa TaxID=5627 RepID=A0A1C7MI12_GRIFR|nr:hypothetical protein A0H81_03511 [Grifola frondosa]
MPSPFELDNILGATFLDNIFAAIFYGITTVQTFTYYKHSGKDPWVSTILIFILWILDGLHLALITHTLYEYTVKDFSDLLAIALPSWVLAAQIVVAGVSDLLVRRSENIAAVSEVEYYSLSWVPYSTCVRHNYRLALLDASKTQNRIQKNRFYDSGPHAIRYVCELTTPTASAPFAASSRCVHPLPSSLHAQTARPQFIKMPENFIFIAFYFVKPKLFLNSLLATLNTRKHVREIGPSALMSIPLSAMSGTRTVASADGACKPQAQAQDQILQIQIQTTTDTKSDSETHINV